MTVTTTGIAGLDAQLGGGIPFGTTLLLLGEPGNAMPLFCEQFAGGGLDSGEDVTFFQFDRPCAELGKRVHSFVVRSQERKAALTLHDGYAPRFGQGARTRDANAFPVHPKDGFKAILTALQEQPTGRPYRVVVESLSALIREDNTAETLEFIRRLVFLGQEMGGVHLLTLVKGLHDPVLETHLRHLCTGVIEFGAERKGFGIYNYLVVSKLLNVQDPVRILLWKETDKGLWLESTKRVF